MPDYGIARLSQSEILQLPFFSDITNDMLQELLQIITAINLKKGEYVIHEGNEANSIFFIISGSVSIVKRHFNGSEKVIEEIQAPHFFGEMALFDTNIRSASVLAASNVRLAELPWQKLKLLQKSYPELEICLLKKIIQSLSCKLRTCNAKSLMH